MVKPTPNASALACVVGLSVLLAALVLVIAYMLVSGELGPPEYGQGLFPIALLGLGVLFIVMAIWSAWGARFWHRLESRRQAAADGDAVHAFPVVGLAPSAVDSLPPAPIRLRMRRGMKLGLWSWGLLLVALAALTTPNHGLPNFRFDVQSLLVLGAVGFFVAFMTDDWRVAVTASGLTVRAFGTRRTVPWGEARLFAVFRGKGAPSQYELSSAADTLMWMWVRPGTMSARFYEPTMPYGEYDLLMEAMLAFIAAKTTLPLYDLR